LIRATFPMNPAAPLLLRDRPAGLPIRKSIIAIVRIRRPRRQSRDGHEGHRWGHDGLRWGRGRWAAAMVNTAAPLFLVRCPRVLCVDSAIEWVYWPRGCGRWSRGRWSRGRCGRRRWEWCRWHGHRRTWQSCLGAAPACCCAAKILLCLGPTGLRHGEASLAIVRQR